MNGAIRIGTAGWTLPAQHAHRFPSSGTHLERYAQVLDAVEINTSFKKTHRASTYSKWRDAVPETFRFSVKCPRELTHARRLENPDEPLGTFLKGVRELGHKLGPILVQLPPSLGFDPEIAARFFDGWSGWRVVVEPRHESWFQPAVEAFLRRRRLARVAADPPPARNASEPGGFDELVYFRLHGSPRRYRSPYGEAFLRGLATRLDPWRHRECWVIFDNTAEGQAVSDALELRRLLQTP